MFLFPPRKRNRGETVSKHYFSGREHLVEFARSAKLYLVIRDKAIKMTLGVVATKKDPPWTIRPSRVFFLAYLAMHPIYNALRNTHYYSVDFLEYLMQNIGQLAKRCDMTTTATRPVLSPFKNCVEELRANNTSPESQIDAWMVYWSRDMIYGKGTVTDEDIGTSHAEMEGFWNRNPKIAKAGMLKLIANCKFTK